MHRHHSIALIETPSPRDRAEVLGRLPQLEDELGAVVAPVGLGHARRERLVGALRRAGWRVRVHPLEPRRSSEPTPSKPAVERPRQVFFGKDVPVENVRLAEALCGAQALPLARANDPASDEPATVLLTGNESTSAIIHGLAGLSARRIPFGIVRTRDPEAGEYAILKTLLVSEVVGRGSVRIAGHIAAGGGKDVPGEILSDHGPLRTHLSRTTDLLAIVGHSNPQDFGFGGGGILCAQRGAAEAPAGGGHLPCFHDGKCFRSKNPDEVLVGIDELSASILLLAGCYTAQLGRRWANPATSLLQQWFDGGGLAGVFTSDMIRVSGEELLLGLGKLLEGETLGTTIALLNWQQRVLEHRSGFANGVGPFLCMGNPCMRLTGRASAIPFARQIDGRVDLPAAADGDPNGGVIVRMPLPEAPPEAAYYLHGLPTGTWCRGVAIPHDPERHAYVWMQRKTLGELSELRAEPALPIAEHPHYRVFVQTLTNLWPWIEVLQVYARVFPEHGKDAERISKAQAEMLEQRYRFGLYMAGLELPKTLVRPANDPVLMTEPGLRHVQALLRCLRLALIDVIALDDLHAPRLLLPVTGEASTITPHRCACGESRLCAEVCRPLDGRGPQLRALACSCSEAGVEFGETDVTVELEHVQLEARPNEDIVVRLTVEAGPIPVRINGFVMLRSWLLDQRIAGPAHEAFLEPGERHDCELTLTCPRLRPGVYVLWIVVIANAACITRRTMFEVLPPDSTDARATGDAST